MSRHLNDNPIISAFSPFVHDRLLLLLADGYAYSSFCHHTSITTELNTKALDRKDSSWQSNNTFTLPGSAWRGIFAAPK